MASIHRAAASIAAAAVLLGGLPVHAKTTLTFTPAVEVLEFGVTLDEARTQRLKDLRSLLGTASGPHGSKEIRSLFRSATRSFRARGHDGIARSLRRSVAPLLQVAEAGERRVNRSRVRRAAREIAAAALEFQPVQLPGFSDRKLPFYPLVALHYAGQLDRAATNLRKSRRPTQGLRAVPRDIWLESASDGAIRIVGLSLPRGFHYQFADVLYSGTIHYPKSIAIPKPPGGGHSTTGVTLTAHNTYASWTTGSMDLAIGGTLIDAGGSLTLVTVPESLQGWFSQVVDPDFLELSSSYSDLDETAAPSE